MPVLSRFTELQSEIAAWRRDLHQHPEVGFETHRTAAFVTDQLQAFGCDEVKTGIGRTGVVGVVHGRTQASGKVVGLRADIDALPMTEATGLPYASVHAGAMHACGHDGHTAMLLGAAQYLTETRNFDGTAVVIFQPAEEGGGGGLEMCRDGLMKTFGIQEVYGMHNMPGIPLGHFAIRPGAFFAATDEFSIAVQGRGGHAARPHDAIDSTLVAAQLVVALQSVVARNADPMKAMVVSVTSFRTGSEAFNVIPDTVQLRGTVRTMEPAMRNLAETRIRAICAGIAATYGATVTVDYDRNYPVLLNEPRATAFAVEVAQQVATPDEVDPNAPAIMGGEDFAYMLEERPGAYIMVGTGDGPMVHHPAYDFNDDAIPAGCSYWARLVEMSMPIS